MNYEGKRRWLLAGLLLIVLAITGCGFLRNAEKIATTPEPVVVGSDAEEASEAEKAEQKAEAEEQKLISEIRISNTPEREGNPGKGYLYFRLCGRNSGPGGQSDQRV